MLARHSQLFLTAIFVLDGILIAASWLCAYFVRFYTFGLPAPLGIPPLGFYLWFGAVLTPVALLVLASLGLYRSARTSSRSRELSAIAQGIVLVTALAGVASFFTRGDLSRSVLGLFAVIAILAVSLNRLAIRLALRRLRRHGLNLRRVLVVGTGDLAVELARKMTEQRDFGFQVVGLVAAEPGHTLDSLAGIPVVGAVADFPGLAERTRTDLVYLALARPEYQAEDEALRRLSDSTVAVRLVPDLGRAFTLNAGVEDFDGTPVVLITETPWQGWNMVGKRVLDIGLSALGLLLFWPLLLALALWVKVDSPGPVLYRQERVGFNGRRFHMLKFRTMRADAEAEGAGWTRPGDPRRTGAGAVLRRFSLDELPQLWNVLCGHMSLVGPRPERPVYVEQFRSAIPRYMLRHHMKAGITGWAQVNGLRGDTPLDRRIEYDLYYIRNWSLSFDLRILLLTLVRIFRDVSAH